MRAFHRVWCVAVSEQDNRFVERTLLYIVMLCPLIIHGRAFRKVTDNEIGGLSIEPLTQFVAEQRANGSHITADHHVVTRFSCATLARLQQRNPTSAQCRFFINQPLLIILIVSAGWKAPCRYVARADPFDEPLVYVPCPLPPPAR